MKRILLMTLAVLLTAGCGEDKKKNRDDVTDGGPGPDSRAAPDSPGPADLSPSPDLPTPADLPEPEDIREPEDLPEPDLPVAESCNFGYAFAPWSYPGYWVPPQPGPELPGPDPVAHPEPEPPYTWPMPLPGGRLDIVMPGYVDDMPLFERAEDWQGQRCFETPGGVELLTEAQAWDLYKEIAERTTGVPVNTNPGVRTVVGIRGAYPGTFAWHGNMANRFNDTLALLWRETDGTRRVKEFAAHTDTGPVDFGWHASSSLRPNRHYQYENGWHKDYNALRILEWGYQVRDDTNKNGHWDSDRNGWLPPEGAEDHDREGSAHNIHMASVDGPLYSAGVDNWSAGCQVIPGIANWTEFITHAWTNGGDWVSYFLIDARDIDPTVWHECTPDGSSQCPYRIHSLPFTATGNTSSGSSSEWDFYNCSGANEGGPEDRYVLLLAEAAMVNVQVDDDPVGGPDVDVHLLEGNDPDACVIRDNIGFSVWLPPGRYLVVVDSYVEGDTALSGPYTLDVWLGEGEE